MTSRHDLPEIWELLADDRRHGEQLGNADDATHSWRAVPMHQRIPCGWCEGTGRVQHWDGWARRGDVDCGRCAGTGFVVSEDGSHD